MSVIGIEITEKQIKISSDSQTTMGNRKFILPEEKIFQVKNLTLGLSGDTIFQQYLKRFLEELKEESFKLKESYDVCALMDKFFEKYKDNKHLDIKENDNSTTMLITDGIKAYYFSLKNYGCLEVVDYEFIGSGWELAEGAYIAYIDAKYNKNDKLEKAIKIACKKDTYCSEPVKTILFKK